jgi:hypothetical protein
MPFVKWLGAIIGASSAPRVRAIDAVSAKIDQEVYLVNYRDHYGRLLGNHISDERLAELFLFRAWTAQIGYRIFSSNAQASERLIGEVVNASKYFGLKMFTTLHGFSIEGVLQDDFISVIEYRWRDYDSVVPTMPKADRLPTTEIICELTKRLNIVDPVVTYKLSFDFFVQLEFVKRTAIEIGLVTT